jgi:NTE family protein
MPVGVAIKHGANVIVTLGFESPYQRRTTSVLRFAFQLSSIMSNNLLRANYAFHNLAHHTEILPMKRRLSAGRRASPPGSRRPGRRSG